jgi:hypothetical protein
MGGCCCCLSIDSSQHHYSCLVVCMRVLHVCLYLFPPVFAISYVFRLSICRTRFGSGCLYRSMVYSLARRTACASLKRMAMGGWVAKKKNI